MKHITILLFLLFVAQAGAQTEDSTPSDSGARCTGGNALRAGMELDALPYLTGGYSFAGWLGKGTVRLRAVYARFHSPSFITPEGFDELATDAGVLLLDYFPAAENGEFDRWWLGGGLEYWRNSVRHVQSHTEASYDNVIVTIGGGHVWKVWRGLYVNPWAAVHFAVTGRDEQRIGGAAYTPKSFFYEASFKIGWCL